MPGAGEQVEQQLGGGERVAGGGVATLDLHPEAGAERVQGAVLLLLQLAVGHRRAVQALGEQAGVEHRVVQAGQAERLQVALEHRQVEAGVVGHEDVIAAVLDEGQRGLVRVDPGREVDRPQLVDGGRGGAPDLVLAHGQLQAVAEVDVLRARGHRADRQERRGRHIQTGGLAVEHHEARLGDQLGRLEGAREVFSDPGVRVLRQPPAGKVQGESVHPRR